MSGPLASKHVDDMARILQGAALVAAKMAAENPALQRALQADLRKAVERGSKHLQAAASAIPDTHAAPSAGPGPAVHRGPPSQGPNREPPSRAVVEPPRSGSMMPAAAAPLASQPQGKPQVPSAEAASNEPPSRPGPAAGMLHEEEKGWPLGPLDAPSILAEAEEKAMAAVAAAPSRTELETSLAGPSQVADQAKAAPAAASGGDGKAEKAPSADTVKTKKSTKKLREAHVPSSPLGRVLGFASLGASLVVGAARDNAANWLSGSGSGEKSSSPFLTEANAERLADALCRMRGAALKLGQMLSIQDENVMPPQLLKALERVREGADVMPAYQLEDAVKGQLGEQWREKLKDFNMEPIAAASIGQVHAAELLDGRKVAMKIQYPGVGRSIESDVDNVMRLIKVANVLPKGAYVEQAVRVAKKELALECDYRNELAAQARFKKLMEGDLELAGGFHVPDVIAEMSAAQVLTTEWVPGVAINKVSELSQEVRDHVAERLLRLTLKELFEWRFMQTDPNWGNFLYDEESDMLHLIDFGAAREYPEEFVSDYIMMVKACADKDTEKLIETSIKLGFLTGEESQIMMDAHCQAGFHVGLPFAEEGLYDFGAQSMTREVTDLGGVMVKHRLTPPPEEAYSLHRKLSGAFLSCIKLRARVPCREIFMDCFDKWRRTQSNV